MKNRLYIIAAIFFIVMSICGCSKTTEKSNIYTIEINHDQIVTAPILDASFAFTDDIQIIPLQTTNNALLTFTNKFYVIDNEIYFTGEMLEGAIYRFNQEGKFLNSIGKPGRGPGEILFSENFAFMNDSVFFFDHFNQKCIIYSKDGTGYREIPFFGKSNSIGELPIDKFAFINDNMAILTYPDMASHNFMTYNIYTNQSEYFIPTDSISAKCAWGDDNGTIFDKETMYFTLWNNDTLYKYDGKQAKPYIHFNITNRTPQQIMESGLMECMKYEKNNNSISNVNIVGVAENFLIGKYSRGGFVYKFIHDAQNNTTKSAINSFKILSDGGLSIMGHEFIYENNLYWACSPSILQKNIPSILKHGNFNNPQTKEKLEKLLESITEDDNPVIFVKRFK